MAMLFSLTSSFTILSCFAEHPKECEVDQAPPVSRPVLLQQSWPQHSTEDGRPMLLQQSLPQPSSDDHRENGLHVWNIYPPVMSESVLGSFARLPNDASMAYREDQQREATKGLLALSAVTEGATRIRNLQRELEHAHAKNVLDVSTQMLPLAAHAFATRSYYAHNTTPFYEERNPTSRSGVVQPPFYGERNPTFRSGVGALQIEQQPELSATSYRPNEGKNADIVEFGMFAKTFYGIDMRASSFTMDFVLTLHWSDPRAAKLVSPGQQSKTLSDQETKGKIWLPDIEITNRNIRSYEVISTSVTIKATGSVTKVERSLAVIKHKFVVDSFPFDHQNLTVNVASSKLMMDELQLLPMEQENATGVSLGLFNNTGFTLISVATRSFNETDGTLQKSRGQTIISIQRDLDKYLQSHLIPSALHLTISYSVFWLPFIPQFITPRVALSVLSLLSFTTLSLKIDNQLPPGAPFSWNDLFNQNCQWLLFFTVVLNIFSEVLNTEGMSELGKKMNKEYKLFWPLLACISLALVFSATDGVNLASTSRTTQRVLLAAFFLYGFRSVWLIRTGA